MKLGTAQAQPLNVIGNYNVLYSVDLPSDELRVDEAGTAKEIGGRHTAFAGSLETQNLDGLTIAAPDGQRITFDDDFTRNITDVRLDDTGLKHFHRTDFRPAIHKGSPCRRIGGKTAYKVMDTFCG